MSTISAVDQIIVIHPHGKGMESIRQKFRDEGFRVINSVDDEAILGNLQRMPSKLVFVIDDSLKGSQVCAMIRCFSNIPIIALCKKDERSRIRMLDLGADTCVTWPVSPLEMVARVRSLQRRYQQMYPAESDVKKEDPAENGD